MHSKSAKSCNYLYAMKQKEKKDLLTGELFTPKRINQRFSSPANRIMYYNNQANELRHKADFVNKPLHLNHRILNELLTDKEEITLHKQFIMGKGFSFGVHTHFEEYDGKYLYAIYNYLWITLEEEQVKFIKIK